MSYVFNEEDAQKWEKWYQNPGNRAASKLEYDFMLDMIKPVPGKRILDIGCGIGTAFSPMINKRLSVTGLDPSVYMLEKARKRAKHRVDLHTGFAEDLPFEDNTFDYACIMKTLEFVENPQKAIEEAVRVTRTRLFIGCVNSYSVNGVSIRAKRIFMESIYRHAKFFNIWKLTKMARSVSGRTPVDWKCLCRQSLPGNYLTKRVWQLLPDFRCPFGGFVGISITLIPQFRTRPLSLPFSGHTSADSPITGLAKTKMEVMRHGSKSL